MRLSIRRGEISPENPDERLRTTFTRGFGAMDSDIAVTVAISAAWPEGAENDGKNEAIDAVVAVQRAFIGDDALAQILERIEAHVESDPAPSRADNDGETRYR